MKSVLYEKHLTILVKHIQCTKLYSNKGLRACFIPSLNVFDFIQNKLVPTELVECLDFGGDTFMKCHKPSYGVYENQTAHRLVFTWSD